MKLLPHKKIFVTGAARGIGAAIVLKMAENGADIGFSYRANTIAATDLVEKVKALGVKCKAYQCDVTDKEAVEATLQAFLEDFGDIDVLINNAGITKDNLLAVSDFDDWNTVLTTNLTATYVHTQWVMKKMMAARKGNIINMSSVVGISGNIGQANYAASKAGIIGFTKAVAKEVGVRNIRCNALAPGIIETDMTEYIRENVGTEIKKAIALKRFGTPEEVANVALFLASDLSKFVTGQVINVCGGMI